MSFRIFNWGSTSVQAFTTTAPVSYSPTLASNTNVSATSFMWYREGQFMYIEGQIFFSGVGGAGEMTFTLPTTGSPTIDTNYLAGGTNASGNSSSIVGMVLWFNAGVARKPISAHYKSTTTIGFYGTDLNVWSGSLAGNGDSLNFTVKVPIVGWS